MQLGDFAHLYNLEEEFWWFVGMREITAAMLDPVCLPVLDRQILDAGCGTGGMMSWLQRYAGNGGISGIDLTPTALSFCRKRGHQLLAQASVTCLPFPDATFHLLTSFDILEQLPGPDSDQSAINEMARVLKPGGVAFIRVPAYEWMKSDHDYALHTQHRYSLKELKQKMERAGFEILRGTYANSWLFPLAVLRRLVLKRIGVAAAGSDVKPLPAGLRWANRPFTAALRSEALWLRRRRATLSFGLSAICVGRKP